MNESALAPKVVRTRAGMAAERELARADGVSVGFVPTMGFLHEGHLSLAREASRRCDRVVMSIFVNPIQFGSASDLDSYPRDEGRDLELAALAGVDTVYAPSVEDVYPEGFATRVAVSGITEVLCGDPNSRGQAHFEGVTTIVAKLFNLIDPDLSFFGAKDAQQAAVVRRMVRDLDFRTEVVVMPTVREADGLAMSSRNARLEPADRERALALYRALCEIRDVATDGDLGAGLAGGRNLLEGEGIEIEYLEARDFDSFETVEDLGERPVLVAVAAEVGGVRLIDNIVLEGDGEAIKDQTGGQVAAGEAR